MKRFLCIRLPSWPIQRLIVAQPALRNRVVVLHARDPRRGEHVVACSRAARALGVRAGLPLAEAAALVPAAPEQASGPPLFSGSASPASPSSASSAAWPVTAALPYLAEHDAQADRVALEELADWCEQFSPLIGFEDLTPLQPPGAGQAEPARRSDCLYLETTQAAAYFGGEHPLAQRVAEFFARLGYVVRIAMADTLGGAWAMAQFAMRDAALLDAAGPGPAAAAAASSYLVVPPGGTWAALQPLPVTALRLPEVTVSLLGQLGIVRLQQLSCLPRASLRSRFGELLLRRCDQASGQREEVWLAHHAAPRFQVDWRLEQPTADQAALRAVLDQLVERLTTTLGQRGEGVLQCVCRLQLERSTSAAADPLTLRIGLFRPTALAGHLQQLLHLQWERLQLPAPVAQLTLEASLTAPLERRQRELFADSRRQHGWQLAQLVDRLSSRLGQAHVVAARLQRDAQPEFSYRYVPLTGHRWPQPTAAACDDVPRKKRSATRRSRRTRPRGDQLASADNSRQAVRPLALRVAESPAAIPRRLIRPVHLRSPPLPLAVVALAPDGPPVQLWLANQPHRVIRCWGPERIETGWWRGHSVRRDYYRLETQHGHWLWVFRQLSDGNWFLHGMFG